jgi:uncharacterized membrane protein YhaH (DUF805 family)
MNMRDINPIPHLVNPKGRTNRLTYIALSIALGLLSFKLMDPHRVHGWEVILNFPILAASLIVTIRRLHDVGRSGWWVLAMLIPLINIVFFLFLAVFPGKVADNNVVSPQST